MELPPTVDKRLLFRGRADSLDVKNALQSFSTQL